MLPLRRTLGAWCAVEMISFGLFHPFIQSATQQNMTGPFHVHPKIEYDQKQGTLCVNNMTRCSFMDTSQCTNGSKSKIESPHSSRKLYGYTRILKRKFKPPKCNMLPESQQKDMGCKEKKIKQMLCWIRGWA